MFKLSAVFAVITDYVTVMSSVTDYVTVMSSVTDYVTVMSSVLVSCAFRTSSMVLCLWISCSLCGPRPSILNTVHPSLDSIGVGLPPTQEQTLYHF